MEDTFKLPPGRRLFVIGDSFTVAPPPGDPAPTWIRLAAQQLSEHHNESVSVVNTSIMGASQDWCWMQLHAWVESGALRPQDYLIVAMTHPGRYWYLDRIPELSNSNIIDLDRWCSREESRAIELFIKHIQRPRLDAINLVNRLGWLGYQVLKKGLQRPLMIKCFAQDLFQCEEMEELNISNGDLYQGIQYWEFENPDQEEFSNYFSGIDCRYNHLCLTNHSILGPRVAHSLITGETLDLTQGFSKNILKAGLLDNAEFCNKELDMAQIAYRDEQLKKDYYQPLLPWKRRKNLEGRASDSMV